MQQQPREPMDSQSAFTPPSPLDIPELLQLIASYMDKHDVATCLRVSRNWYQAFLPPLWSRLEMKLSKYDPSGPPLPERNKYWSLIQKLILWCHADFKMPCRTMKCRNLTHLEIKDTVYRDKWFGMLNRTMLKNESSLAALIKRHPSSLRVFISNSDTTDIIIGALSGCTQLARLELHSQYFGTLEDWMKWYEPLWSRLETLSWKGGVIHYDIPKDRHMDIMAAFSNKGPTTIKYLDLEVLGLKSLAVDLIHALLITKSPELVHLSCDSIDHVSSFFGEISQKTPFGQRIQTLRLGFTDMGLKGLKEIFGQYPRLSRFECNDGIMDMKSLTTIQMETPQFLTKLKVLGLRSTSNSNTGELAHAILCSLPSLEELTINYITDIDVRKGGGGPWVCTGLKKLEMAIVLLDGQSEEMVLERVGSLKNLMSIDLTMVNLSRLSLPDAFTGDNVMVYAMKLSLDSGLDKLRTLERLEKFRGTSEYKYSKWTEAEALWVRKHWTRLTHLAGVRLDAQAGSLLQYRSY